MLLKSFMVLLALSIAALADAVEVTPVSATIFQIRVK
jgi:hypothetical protein